MHLPSAEARTHAYVREHGVSRRLYACVRWPANVVLRLWFRVKLTGSDHVPGEGPVIVAPNHKNFLDPFFVAANAERLRAQLMVRFTGIPPRT